MYIFFWSCVKSRFLQKLIQYGRSILDSYY